MNNFNPKLQDATDEELMNMINKLAPNYASLASDELSRRKTQLLIETTNKNSIVQEKSSVRMEKLTISMLLLAVLQFIAAIIQLIISFAYEDNIDIKIFGFVMTVIILVLIYVSSRLLGSSYFNKYLYSDDK